MPFTALCLMTGLPRLHYGNQNMHLTVCRRPNDRPCWDPADTRTFEVGTGTGIWALQFGRLRQYRLRSSFSFEQSAERLSWDSRGKSNLSSHWDRSQLDTAIVLDAELPICDGELGTAGL